jgi:(p)ppGpp synthase/HD superfamily hydrolase
MAQVQALSCRVDASIEVRGRVKSIASASQKMTSRAVGAHQILDIIGVRAITRNTQDCYRLVALIHLEFFTLGAEYDDYVLTPKASGYRAIHTTVVSPSGLPVEVQVQADWMEKLSESGPAAHSQYKQRQRTVCPTGAWHIADCDG